MKRREVVPILFSQHYHVSDDCWSVSMSGRGVAASDPFSKISKRGRAWKGNMGAFALDCVEGSVESQDLREAATRGARTNEGMESAFARNGWKQDGILMKSDKMNWQLRREKAEGMAVSGTMTANI
jgi:hypothetical protein